MNQSITEFILKRKFLFLFICILILLRLTIFSNRYSGLPRNIDSREFSNVSEPLNLSNAPEPLNLSQTSEQKIDNRFLNYFVYKSLTLTKEEKLKSFCFTGEVLDYEIPYPYRTYAYIRLFTNDQNIVYEDMREIDSASSRFFLQKDLYTHSNYDFLQYGIMFEGPLKPFIEGSPFIELGYLETPVGDRLQKSISPSLRNKWSNLSKKDAISGNKNIVKSSFSDKREIKLLFDRKNRSMKIEPNFTQWRPR